MKAYNQHCRLKEYATRIKTFEGAGIGNNITGVVIGLKSPSNTPSRKWADRWVLVITTNGHLAYVKNSEIEWYEAL